MVVMKRFCSVIVLISLISMLWSCATNNSADRIENKNTSTSSSAPSKPQPGTTETTEPDRATNSFQDYIRSIGRPVLVDFGASSCTPCKMMEPILKDLQENYADQFETIFVHVNEEPAKTAEFKINVIPTQIFFSSDGKEVYRHIGFFAKEEILKTFQENGIPIR